MIEHIGIEKTWKEYIDYYESHEEVRNLNSKFGYNEGYDKSIKNDKKIK